MLDRGWSVSILFSLLLVSGLALSGSQAIADVETETPVYGTQPYQEIWSDDFGVTFNQSTSLNSSTTVDTEGDLHLVWQDDRNGSWNIFYLKLRNENGEKLINDMRITRDENTSMNPKVVTKGSDHAYIIWEEKIGGEWKLFFTKLLYSVEHIEMMIDKVQLAVMGTGGPKDYSFVVDSSNEVHVVYERTEAGIQNIYYLNIEGDGTVMEERAVTSSDQYSYDPKIKLSVNQDDHLHLFWLETDEKNRGIFYKKIDQDDGTEVVRKRLTVVDKITRYEISVDGEGFLHLVFDDNRYHDYKFDVIYTRLDSKGETVQDDTVLTVRGDDANSFSPSINVDSRNEIYVSWAESRAHQRNTNRTDFLSHPHDIYLTKLGEDGSRLYSDIRLTVNGSLSRSPHLITDNQNEQHILWSDKRTGFMNIRYERTYKPDPAITSIEVPPEPEVDTTIKVDISISNKGPRPIETDLNIYGRAFSASDIFDGSVPQVETVEQDRIATRSISLDGYEDQTYVVNLTMAEKGFQNVSAAVFDSEYTEEGRYENNVATEQFFVRYFGLNISADDTSTAVDPGQNTTFDFNLTNLGNVDQKVTLSFLSSTGVDLPNSSSHLLDAAETRQMNFTVHVDSDKRAGPINITAAVESEENPISNDTLNFTLEVAPVYGLKSDIWEIDQSEERVVKKSELERLNYTLRIEVKNLANTEQRISLYVINGSEYARVEQMELYLERGESRFVSLNLTGHKEYQGTEDLNVTVRVQSQNERSVQEDETLWLKGKEKQGETSWFGKIPWRWIGIFAVLITVVLVSIRIVYIRLQE